MKRIALSLLFLSMTHVNLRGQSAATFHVFPQVADGLAGNTAYFSTVAAVNVSAQQATCTFRLYGGIASRISGSPTFTLAPSGGVGGPNTVLASGTVLPLATGYGTLTCDQPVAAYVGYLLYTAATSPPTLAAGATVFSSPPTTRAELLVTNASGYRTAFAIANDTDSMAQYQMSVVSASGEQVAATQVSVPARSNVAKFVDELVTLPSSFLGGAFITSSSGLFSTVGLLFNGSVFLSEPAVTFGP